MNKYSLSALVAAGLLAGAATSATAADLGGNCCADLEERIAELEATTVRKGNRKVSLTITGWVGEQMTWWDDGHEKNVYVTGLGATLSTNFRFTGTAQITSDVQAGYLLHIEARASDPLLFLNQNVDDAGTGLFVFQSYWFLKSNTYGQVSLGLMSPPTDNLAILADGSGSLVQANWVLFEGAGFFLRFNGMTAGQQNGTLGASQLIWGSGLNCYTSSAATNTQTGVGIGGDCTAAPLNVVKYDSPSYGGFSVSASYGEDDFWDVAGRYAGEWSGFKVAAAIGYSQATDQNPFVVGSLFNNARYEQIQVGGYVEHIRTGLFGYGAYLRENISGMVGAAAGINSIDPEHWYVKGGIRAKCLPYGATIAYGEFSQGINQVGAAAFLNNNVRSSEINWWGLGVVQEIDAAAMSIWVKYRNVDGSLTTSAADKVSGLSAGKNSLDSFQMVTFGALINF